MARTEVRRIDPMTDLPWELSQMSQKTRAKRGPAQKPDACSSATASLTISAQARQIFNAELDELRTA
jgi:hypothetical protein